MRRTMLLVVIGLIAHFLVWPDALAQARKKKTPTWSDQKDAFGDRLPTGAVARIGTTRYRLSELTGPQTVSFSRDGKLFAVLGPDDIQVWELPAWTRLKLIRARTFNKENPPQFLGLGISPDSKQLITFEADSQAIWLLDIASGQALKKLPVKKQDTNGPPFFKI